MFGNGGKIGCAAGSRRKKNLRSFEKTAGLMLHMCEFLFGQLKVVISDSSFCVMEGILELRKRGVFAAALIKKRRDWPKYIKGDEIKTKMENEPSKATW